jgi:recombination protein RecT
MKTDSTPAQTAKEVAKPEAKAVAKTNREKFLTLVQNEKVLQQMSQSVCDNDPSTVRRISALVSNAAVKNPAIYDAAHSSILKVLLDCCSLGIEPNGRDAHVLTYNTRTGVIAQLMIDYKGFITLAMKSERISGIRAEVVCKNDSFTWKNGKIDHEVDFFGDRGELVGAYAVAVMKDGTELSAVMSKKEIDAIRARSRAATSGPWVTDYAEMAKKTVVRRLSKTLPLSPSAIAAIDYDDKQNFDFADEPKQTTAARKQSADALADALMTTPATDPMAEAIDAEIIED